jgi:hypothetical protein
MVQATEGLEAYTSCWQICSQIYGGGRTEWETWAVLGLLPTAESRQIPSPSFNKSKSDVLKDDCDAIGSVVLDIPLEDDELDEVKKEKDDDASIDTGVLAGLGNGCPTRRVLETDVTDGEGCSRDESYETSVSSLFSRSSSSAHIVTILRLVRELDGGAFRSAAVSRRAARSCAAQVARIHLIHPGRVAMRFARGWWTSGTAKTPYHDSVQCSHSALASVPCPIIATRSHPRSPEEHEPVAIGGKKPRISLSMTLKWSTRAIIQNCTSQIQATISSLPILYS